MLRLTGATPTDSVILRGGNMQAAFVRRILATGMAVSLAACQDIQGMTETLSSSGPVSLSPSPMSADWKDGRCTTTAPSPGQAGLFQMAYACAWVQANWVATNGAQLDSPTVQSSYKVLLTEGLGLVRGNCSDFFRSRGDRQMQVSFGRDLVAMGGTTAAAIIGLTGGSALALSIIALSGATLYAGLDVYTRNFLFGADNIEAVRTLTMRTLNGNADEILAQARNKTLTFQQVTAWIMDNQEICKPASIAAAVRVKLRGGNIDDIRAAGEDAAARAQLDSARMLQISALLGLPGGTAISETRLALACWATTAEGMQGENAKIIKEWLPRDPYMYGPDSGSWPGQSAQVASVCQQLSGATQTMIKSRIAELAPKAAAGSGSTPAPAAVLEAPATRAVRRVDQPAPPPPSSTPPSSNLPSGSSYVPMRVF